MSNRVSAPFHAPSLYKTSPTHGWSELEAIVLEVNLEECTLPPLMVYFHQDRFSVLRSILSREVHLLATSSELLEC